VPQVVLSNGRRNTHCSSPIHTLTSTNSRTIGREVLEETHHQTDRVIDLPFNSPNTSCVELKHPETEREIMVSFKGISDVKTQRHSS